jgi:transposase
VTGQRIGDSLGVMKPSTSKPSLCLSPEQRAELETAVRAGTSSQRLVTRAKLVLLLAEGLSEAAVARRSGTCRATVARWRERYTAEGLPVLDRDEPRAGRKRTTLTEAKVREIVDTTRLTQPPAATHWSLRTLAAQVGVAPSQVHEVWKAHRLQPHRVETWKLSLDPDFSDKLADVVGLYLNPPERAVVLSVDEKSQIQALERTRPVTAVREGRPECQPHDYRRHGTTTLFSALNVVEGIVHGKCLPRHTHVEFLSFLKEVTATVPEGLSLHVILDNYATHKHAAVRAWLAENPHVHFHFTPTSCSWANLVERFFSELTTRRIRRDSFRSVAELEEAIAEYLAYHNEQRRPYIWTKSFADIVASINRCYRN